jgi:hypothetical protein
MKGLFKILQVRLNTHWRNNPNQKQKDLPQPSQGLNYKIDNYAGWLGKAKVATFRP